MFVHDHQGIDHITLALAHLFPFRIPDEGMDIYILKWDIPHEMNAHHHHSGHPEKEDVKSRD